ncbi:basic amino acid ABC transporter substrate-binding protein [Bacillus sp. DTU_2020_1000418_1_SI_GHA_SEK_038]|uniref:basic amino acid ABC transporter substrate-binding protein n=1 Tax=Bacillus sp. DTU_2020_1000418_1_SI_GHA_SEK_038 TaxID=3077585 RepID=UPI0028EFF218|nr:basic amino acid ABC transporter substrate-binding protein [Bacillus sp. DTU_2020_1000418_1_SI_GHA_SEK_038]WNS76363.1 basic amino acid ABC transporter substrate-binding protein [Bacillus sp. DTU_2020_1000418_1_SI_GHA_SEK_038]
MKRFTIFAIVMIFSLILSACGTSQKTSEGSGDSAASGEGKKKLKIATEANYAPFVFLDNGEMKGFDVDFMSAVAKEAGYEYEMVHVGWDPLFVEVKDKLSDMGICAITINDVRSETYDFSAPYYLSTNEILVPEGSDIKSAADLKNDKVVAVLGGTTGEAAVEKILGVNNKNIKKFDNNNLAILELTSGGADAVVADNAVVQAYAQNNPNDKLNVISDKEGFENEFYGLMFPKGSELKAEFDVAVTEVLKNGTYTEIYKKWFGVEPDVETILAQQK